VIDSTGVLSPYRESLPESFGIQNTPKDDELFFSFRGFFAPNEGQKRDEINTNRCYLKYLNKRGIAWCVQDPPTGQLNVMIGQLGGLTEQEIDEALNFLRRDNPILGDKLVRGGTVNPIPVRYPLSKMAVSGYALIGNSAFMTFPLIGSGIAFAMKAGVYLAEAVNKRNSADIAALWSYQVKFMQDTGASFVAIDIMKRWLINCDPSYLKVLFEKNIITGNSLFSMTDGEMPSIDVEQFEKAATNAATGKKNLSFIAALSGVMAKCFRAYAVAKLIPKRYDVKKASAWSNDLDKLFRE
jgi:flavin-dependent dehydrogenase